LLRISRVGGWGLHVQSSSEIATRCAFLFIHDSMAWLAPSEPFIFGNVPQIKDRLLWNGAEVFLACLAIKANALKAHFGDSATSDEFGRLDNTISHQHPEGGSAGPGQITNVPLANDRLSNPKSEAAARIIFGSRTSATVIFTGCFAHSWRNGQWVSNANSRPMSGS
jgi:GTP-dependent phosphoenolpyruvate carboxykinase